MEINYALYKCLTSRVTKRLLSLNDIQPVHLLPQPNQTSAMAESHTRETNCVYVETSLDTHLLVLLHDRETISDFKGKRVYFTSIISTYSIRWIWWWDSGFTIHIVKLCKEHHQCFPKLGEIDISAVKVVTWVCVFITASAMMNNVLAKLWFSFFLDLLI